MILTLEARAKSVPGNYDRQGCEVIAHSEVGSTLTSEAWAKADRQANPHYDWNSYQSTHVPKRDHPEIVARQQMDALFESWDRLLAHYEKNLSKGENRIETERTDREAEGDSGEGRARA